MRKIIILSLLFSQLIFLVCAKPSLKIYRSKSHEDKTGKLTPLVVSLSTDDVREKTTAADLIFVVDVSGSMWGNPMTLVKDTLNYIVSITNENDNIALIQFHSSAKVISGLTKMTEENKKKMRTYINNLSANGGTNIYSGLELGLQQVTKDYSKSDRVCSIILLSDGYDGYRSPTADIKFNNLIASVKKDKYIFSTHSFGYGSSHDVELMKKISQIRDGSYIFIKEFKLIKEAFIKVYGYLSTITEVNLHLKIQSKFKINDVLGKEEMYKSSLTTAVPYTFDVYLLQVVGGKTYSYVTMMDIPETTPYGTEVLNATVVGTTITANYLWDNYYDPAAYEEYIRCIAFTIIADGYIKGQINGLIIIQNGIAWIKLNYEGYFNWEGVLSETVYDFKSFSSYGKANILSKIRELKSQQLGMHFSDENSYINKILDDETDIDIIGNEENDITAEQNINFDSTKNYYYFYLKEGIAELNGTHFSGEHSSIMIYSEVPKDKITLKPLTAKFLYYYWSEKKTRIQNKVDIGRGGKFIFKKDFPFDFYTKVDDKNDILFNIQFLNLEYSNTLNEVPDFEITAYIIDENKVKTLSTQNYNYKPSSNVFSGYYDKGARVGKIFIKKEDISRNINYNLDNYIYVIVKKTSNAKNAYKKIEGQFSFIQMNKIERNIPESFYIFNNLLPGQRNPHKYSIKMDPTPGKDILIEFASSSNELNCKILKYNKYVIGSDELYSDFNEYEIRRETRFGKTYIYVTQSTDKDKLIDSILVSIFSSNQNYVASSDYSKLEYTLRYTRDSDYGLYEYRDLNEKYCEFDIVQNDANANNIIINFSPIKTKKNGEQNYINEKTRFYLKAYSFDKKKEFIKGTVALLDKNVPSFLEEKTMSENAENKLKMNINIDSENNNYFFALYTISEITGEILGYQGKKLYKKAKNIIINDNNSYENEYNNNIILDFKVASDIKKSHLLIQISDLDDGESVTLEALIGNDKNNKYQGQNKILIPNDKCKSKDIKLYIKLNYGESTEYYLKIYMINKIEIDTGIKNSFTYAIQYLLHENSEYPKVCNLYDGNLFATSSVVNLQSTKLSKISNEGKPIYGNATLYFDYSPDANLIQPYNLDYYILTYHNKQNRLNSQDKENIITLKDHDTILRNIQRKEYIYQKTSSVPLKDGNVLISGIKKIEKFGEQTVAEIYVYNPKTGVIGNGISFNAYSKYISCYEQSKNYVNCIYVSFENKFVSKLKIEEIFVNGNILTQKRDRVIKSFYTQFYFLKAIPYNEKEGIILFETTGETPSENYLFYYHIKILPESDFIEIKRYELLYRHCLYNEDSEYYNADIAILSHHKVYAACETAYNRFRGFIIYQNSETFSEFNFNNFDAKDVKSPVFAKFGKSLGLFYTHIDEEDNKNTVYQILNYPDCFNYNRRYILIPQSFVKELDFIGKVFLSNPYPASVKEDIKVRFKPYLGLSIVDDITKSPILPDTDYQAALTLIIKPEGKTGLYNIEYTATREDPMDGIIVGKTCKLQIYTPDCLEPCLSCTQMGNEEHHMCLGCKEGPYYIEQDPEAINEGYGRPHFCRSCNVSCSSCYGGFLEYIPTTNCIKCDYENNFYHYDLNIKTCISNETKSYWEEVLGTALYLDKSAGENNKEKWRWKHCHKNCAECFEAGDDNNNKCFRCKNDLYFYCNQTLENGGIPGSCHSDCKDNGFFIKVDEDREKCCPCSEHCHKCINETQCKKCYPEFFLTKNEYKNETICDSECGYCLAEDRIKWECVNCKTDYPTPKYTLNKTCVDEIPFIFEIKRYHHIIDDTCNLLHGCKEGCHKCAPWYSDSCTECNSSFYMQDFYGKEQPKTFHCYDSDTCKGIKPYIHNEKELIGGIPKLVDGINVCYNCKLREGNYRQPTEYVCGIRKNGTYVDIYDYNKLSKCYTRCKTCDYWGNGMIMNCSLCKDPSLYEPKVKIGDYYNCYRKAHPCGIFPYYHDYDKADELGLEDCNVQCDICMKDFICPKDLPFYVFSTRECVEYCDITQVLGEYCILHHKEDGMLLIEHPFGLKHNYDFLNNTVYLQELISESFFSYIKKDYKELIDSSYALNHLGEGKIFNLPESKVFIGNNMSIELSSVKLELEKLNKINIGEISKINNSIIDLSVCESYLKKKYGLKNEEDLVIFKGDFLEELSELYLQTKIVYQLFSTSMGAFLPLNDCKEANISTKTYKPLNASLFTDKLQLQYKSILDGEIPYNPFNPNSEFYTDICTPFTSENGYDVTLDLRRKNYFNEKNNLCEDNCAFGGYNETIKMFTCNCTIKKSADDTQNDIEIKPMIIPNDFYQKIETYSNIKVIKCYKNVFSLIGLKMNIGSYILFACFAEYLGIVIYYLVKGEKKLDDNYSNLANATIDAKINNDIKINNDNNIKANPPKNDNANINATKDAKVPDTKSNEVIIKNREIDPDKIKKDYVYTDDDLNLAKYDIAFGKDKRSFLSYYWSLIKMKQLSIFTFYTYTDHNLRIIKIALFLLFISFYLAFTALFFNDDIMREIYIYKGSTNAAIHITNILLSSFCCLVMNLIIRFVSYSERDIAKAQEENNPDKRKAKFENIKRKLKLKLKILFIIFGLIMILCWYYVSAFCAVFKNSQGHYFLNVFWTFILCNLWPFITSLIAPIFRIKSLKNDKRKCMYNFSQIVAYF